MQKATAGVDTKKDTTDVATALYCKLAMAIAPRAEATTPVAAALDGVLATIVPHHAQKIPLPLPPPLMVY